MTKPTRYQVMQAALLFSGASAVLLTSLLMEWTPPGILRAIALILCGANFSGIWYNWLLKASFETHRRMRVNYDSLYDAFQKILEVNRALVANRIRVHMVGRLADTEEKDNQSIH